MALTILCVGAFIFYKMYLPTFIADAITKPETPDYLPAFVQQNMKRYKAPINDGATTIIEELHERNIPVSEVIKALDETSEEDIQQALSELKAVNVKTTDQAFDIITSHVKGDIDLEPLREPFKKNVDVKTIQTILKDKNFTQYQDLLDPSTIKNVAKEVLIQKEAAYRAKHGAD